MPTAPPSRCSKLDCNELATKRGRCGDHQPSGWTERRRPQDDRTDRDRLGISTHEWMKLAGQVMKEHRGVCHVCGRAGADQVDHIVPLLEGGAKTDPSNLAPIHAEPCHRIKTAAELARARRRAAADTAGRC
jgi:5-methylcytosine-specific restriction enzyme A